MIDQYIEFGKVLSKPENKITFITQLDKESALRLIGRHVRGDSFIKMLLAMGFIVSYMNQPHLKGSFCFVRK